MAPVMIDLRNASVSTRRGGKVGAWSWVLAVVLFLVAQLVAGAGWTTPYSWTSNNISDLGATSCGPWPDGHRWVCSPWHKIMNIGFVITGALVVLGVVLRWRTDRAFAGLAGLCVLVAGAAYAVAGLAPGDRHENVHVVLGALPIFLLGNVGIVIAALRRSGWGWPRRLTTALLGLLGLAAMVLFFSGNYLGLGMGGMERVIVWPLLLVLLVAGTTDLRRRT